MRVYGVQFISPPIWLRVLFLNTPTQEDRRRAVEAFFEGTEGYVTRERVKEVTEGFMRAPIRTLEVIENEAT